MANTFAVSSGATAIFNPISSQLANLPDGAGTIAVLFKGSASSPAAGDLCGLTDGSGSQTFNNFYHSLSFSNDGHNEPDDDDGLVMNNPGSGTNLTLGSTAWWIFVVSWPAGAAHLEQFSWVDLSVGTWTHVNSDINNGGNRVGPTTAAGQFNIGYGGDNARAETIALCGAWAGVQLTNTSGGQVEALATNLKTSDWYNNAGGTPTTLVECTSLTPTDIGAHPSTFKKVMGTIALTGGIPTNGTTNWNFDGIGSNAVLLNGASKSKSKSFSTIVTGTPVNLHGASKGASSSSAIPLVVVPSAQGVSATASRSVATPSVGPIISGVSRGGSESTATLSSNALVGETKGASKSVATLTVAEQIHATTRTTSKSTGTLTVAVPLAGASRTAAKSSAILSNDLLSGVSKGGSKSQATLSAVVALSGVSKSASRSVTRAGAVVALGGQSNGGSRSAASLALPVALSGTSQTKSRTTASAKVAVALGGSSKSASRSFSSLAVHPIVALHGTSKSTSRSSAAIHIAVPLRATSTLASTSSASLKDFVPLAAASRTGSSSSGHLTSVIPVALGGASRSKGASSARLSVTYPLVASSATRSRTTGTLSTGVVFVFEIDIGITDSSRSGMSLMDVNRTSIAMSDGG